MPNSNVASEPNILQVGMLIGLGCLIYNHRHKTILVPHPREPEEEYKKFLFCTAGLLQVAGLKKAHADFKYRFANYASDPKFRVGIDAFLAKLQRTRHDGLEILGTAYSNLNCSAEDLLRSNSAIIYQIVDKINRILQSLEKELNSNKFSVFFNYHFESMRISEFYHFERFWKIPLDFMLKGYEFFPEELNFDFINNKQPLNFSFNNKSLVIDLGVTAYAYPIDFAELHAIWLDVEPDHTITVKILNLDLLDEASDAVLIGLTQELLRLPTISKLKICLEPLGQSIFYGLLRIIKAEISGEVGFDDPLMYLFAIPSLERDLLRSLFSLHAHMLDMPNVTDTNIWKHYWRVIANCYDAKAAANWLGWLQQDLQLQSEVINLQNKAEMLQGAAYLHIRDGILHGMPVDKSEKNESNGNYEIAIRRRAVLRM